MARKGPRLRPLARELARRFPDLEDPALAVLGTAGGLAAGALRRRRREAALNAAAEPV